MTFSRNSCSFTFLPFLSRSLQFPTRFREWRSAILHTIHRNSQRRPLKALDIPYYSIDTSFSFSLFLVFITGAICSPPRSPYRKARQAAYRMRFRRYSSDTDSARAAHIQNCSIAFQPATCVPNRISRISLTLLLLHNLQRGR